ncbi:unnamed protein product [Caenorhabditis auriculariae]|uniref:Phosphatidic acid phosphatase type 2/haloperoxidase domain-containing protein n=1 Tax=Caenorhabditis auriculariae TaxID=2777116 RepID=A0A8S1H1W6_9PELO|nr:unnamed protein product [Caenorhabditis auriculariae]
MPEVLRHVTFSGRLVMPKKDALQQNWRDNIIKALIYMVLDISIVLAVSIMLFYWFAGKAVAPYQRPFPCGDDSLKRPFKPNTVGLKHLLAISLGSPFFVIVIVEGILFYKSLGINRLSKFFATTTLVYMKYLLTYALCTFIMEYLKCSVGRMRPHFVEVCNPDWKNIKCDSLDKIIQPEDMICTNPDKHRIRTARTSFPSGHTAAAFHLLIFLFIYLNRMSSHTRVAEISFFRWLVLPTYTVWTLFTAITRVTDFWHFPTDVLGGIILAACCVIPVFFTSWRSTSEIYAPRDIVPDDSIKLD